MDDVSFLNLESTLESIATDVLDGTPSSLPSTTATPTTTTATTATDEAEVEVNDEGEIVPWSNFKPVHGNTGMKKYGGRPLGAKGKNAGTLKQWQMSIVDIMLEKPGIKRVALAKELDVTPEWLSRVMNSDAFLSYRDQRIASHQKTLSEDIVNKASETALKGLEKLHSRMTLQSDTVSTGDMVKATEMAGKMLGLGTAKQVNAPVQVNNYGVDPELLARARQSMEKVGSVNTAERLAREREIEDAQVIEAPSFENTIQHSPVKELPEEIEEGDREGELFDKVIQAEGWEGVDPTR